MKTQVFFRSFILILVSITFMEGIPDREKICDHATNVDRSAILELEKTDRGFLISRIAPDGATDDTTINDPANSLLIYITAIAGAGEDVVTPGFYYWDAGKGRWMGLVMSMRPTSQNNNILSRNGANQLLPGSPNIVLGAEAFGDLSGPSNYVIAIGQGACAADTTSGDAYVVAIGKNTAYNNGGTHLNAFGSSAGENNFEWSSNMFGNLAGQFNSGSELNAMGPMAAQHNTHASVNAFGLSAAHFKHNSDVNALGWQAAQYNTVFQVNALGAQAGKFNSGDHNIAIGQYAVFGDSLVIEGEGNIRIGYSAANNIGVGACNICIGFDADIPHSTANYQIIIGDNIIREADGMIRIKDFLKLTPQDNPPAPIEEGTINYDAIDHMFYMRTDIGWHALC